MISKVISYRELFNIEHVHVATVRELDNGLFDIEGVHNTPLKHIKRRGSKKALDKFVDEFNLYYKNNIPEKQSSIFDFI